MRATPTLCMFMCSAPDEVQCCYVSLCAASPSPSPRRAASAPQLSPEAAPLPVLLDRVRSNTTFGDSYAERCEVQQGFLHRVGKPPGQKPAVGPVWALPTAQRTSTESIATTALLRARERVADQHRRKKTLLDTERQFPSYGDKANQSQNPVKSTYGGP